MFGDSLNRLVFWFKFRAHDFDITYLELRKKCFIWNEKNLLKNWKHPVLFLSQKDPKVTRNEVSISFCPQIFKKMTPLREKDLEINHFWKFKKGGKISAYGFTGTCNKCEGQTQKSNR